MLLRTEFRALKQVIKGREIDGALADHLRDKWLLSPQGTRVTDHGLDMMEAYRASRHGVMFAQIIAVLALAIAAAALFIRLRR